MSPFLAVVAVLFVVLVSVGLGWLLHMAFVQSRADEAAWRADEATHRRLLAGVRLWQGSSAGETPPLVWRVTGHRAGVLVAVRRAWVAVTCRATPTPTVAAPTAQAEPPADVARRSPELAPFNPAYRGAAHVEVPFDAYLCAGNAVLGAAAAGCSLPAAANDEVTTMLPQAAVSVRGGAHVSH